MTLRLVCRTVPIIDSIGFVLWSVVLSFPRNLAAQRAPIHTTSKEDTRIPINV